MPNISKQDPIKGYKIFNSDWTCRDKQYKLGETFHEEDVEICSRGMHFCTKLRDCFDYYDYSINRHVAKVEGYGMVDYRTDDSKVAVSDLKIIKELTLKDSKKLRKAVHNYYGIPKSVLKGTTSEEYQLKAVKQSAYFIQFITNPSEKVQLEAVKNSGYAIQYITNPSEGVQLEAVRNIGYAIQCITNPSEKIKLAAVKNAGYVIGCITNPSEKVKLAAVKKFALAIRYIDNPSMQVQLEAIKEDNRAIEFIKNPCLVVRMANIWYN